MADDIARATRTFTVGCTECHTPLNKEDVPTRMAQLPCTRTSGTDSTVLFDYLNAPKDYIKNPMQTQLVQSRPPLGEW